MALQSVPTNEDDIEKVQLRESRETASSDTDSQHSFSARSCRFPGKRVAILVAVLGLAGTAAVFAPAETRKAAMKHMHALRGKAKSMLGLEETVQGQGPHGSPSKAQMEEATSKAVTGLELKEPEVLRSTPGKPIKLKMTATLLPVPWVGGAFLTRAYNGVIPGPTIRTAPGEDLEIELTNDLGPGPGEAACDFTKSQLGLFMNPATICMLNYTNFHTHGLHVSPSGNQDNIWKTAAPGETLKYKIHIPENHMGGTHWYHPHKHHATAAQAGGGAHGALLVDDPPGSLPAYVEEMPEKLMFLSLVNVAKAMRMEAWGMGTEDAGFKHEQVMWKNTMYPDWGWDMITGSIAEHGTAMQGSGLGIEPKVVVNGQWKPKVTLEESKWYRFRMAFAAIEQRVEIHPVGEMMHSAHCEFQLLSKDGIYLHEAPRQIERIYLVSGSRADILVSCTCGSMLVNPCELKLNATAKWQPMGTTNHAITMEETTDLMMTIVTGTSPSKKAFRPKVRAPILQPFEVRRPCYLADLRMVEVPPANHHKIDLPTIYPMIVHFDGNGTIWGHETPPPMAHLPVGSVQEWQLTGIRYHPFHSHVNPYQIVEMWNDPYYMEGDWHDTILPTSSGTATIRLALDKFTGHMIAHCHLLEHEDNGMMGYLQITGTEGTMVTNTADPTCYNTAFPGPPPQHPALQWR